MSSSACTRRWFTFESMDAFPPHGGVYAGLVFGVLPALGGSAGMAVLLPFIFGMEPTYALPMMIGMMAVTPTADTFSFGADGHSGRQHSQATVLDGFPMSKRGEAARALVGRLHSSLVGGLFGALILTFADRRRQAAAADDRLSASSSCWSCWR